MIAIVDYQAGNPGSVYRALAEVGVNDEVLLVNDPQVLITADKVIVPGVGAAGTAMETLHDLQLNTALRQRVQAGNWLLGICLGSQILLTTSEEDGGTPCLDFIPGQATRFSLPQEYKIPHMGWNNVHHPAGHPLFANIAQNSTFYFVHSYYTQVEPQHTCCTTEYGITFPSVIQQDNVIGIQFHPEKSGKDGLQLLYNFTKL